MNSIRDMAKEWADQIGYKRAVGRLVSREVSTRAAELICSGEYPSEPKALRRVLIEEMRKDGFTLADEEAS